MSGRSLRGKSALVTGASGGIGRATALRLAAEGALVAAHYGRSRAAGEETVGLVTANGGDAFTVGADFCRTGSIAELFATLDRELIRRTGSREFDILVNNAGLGPRALIEEVTESELDRTITVNLKAPFLIIQTASERLRVGGRIINVSSIATRGGFPELAAYAPTKAGLEALTLLLAPHFGPRGITVNAVLPGATATDMNPRVADPQVAADLTRTIALRRMGHADDIADAIAFLASDDARWITGERIAVSGGQRL
jgi:3-oxoacyl-[acyl-carrier protein] reductase